MDAFCIDNKARFSRDVKSNSTKRLAYENSQSEPFT